MPLRETVEAMRKALSVEDMSSRDQSPTSESDECNKLDESMARRLRRKLASRTTENRSSKLRVVEDIYNCVPNDRNERLSTSEISPCQYDTRYEVRLDEVCVFRWIGNKALP